MAGPAALPDELAARVDAWIEQAVARLGVSVRDARKGVQSVSTVYVQRRNEGRISTRTTEGTSRRAALATYYAPLHFLTTYHAASALDLDVTAPRILDLGCGTGACGAALGWLASDSRPAVTGLDRSGWALGEARATWRAFGLRGRARRTVLPAGLPRPRPGDLAVAGFVLNECEPEQREALLGWLADAARAGGHVLVLEPLATRISPWWDEACARLGERGLRSETLRFAIERPRWVAEIDRASGLDHREIGARVLLSS